MKRTVRLILSLSLAVAMALSMSLTAFAAESSVTFNGKAAGFDFAPGSEYTVTDLFENFKDVMPGDSLTETVTVTNKARDCDYVKIYMKAVSHSQTANPLSPKVAAAGESVASMTDFLAQLSMRVYNGSELIYEASPDELDGLKSNVLLGTFRQNQSATLTVELDVPITLGNEYANREGEVDWVFTVEGYDDPVADNPQTGDYAIMLAVGVMAVSAAAIVILLLLAKKKRN